MAHSRQDYEDALKVINEYVEQLTNPNVRLQDIKPHLSTVTIYGSKLNYWVQEIDEDNVLLSTRLTIDDSEYDDFWIHYSEIEKIL